MRQKYVKNHGFTLIEVLIASGLFAVVALIGFMVIANTRNLENKTTVQRNVEQAARFSLESVARNLRLANGFYTLTNGSRNYTKPPFEITNASIDPLSGLTVGDGLKIYTTDPTQATNKQHTLLTIGILSKEKSDGTVHRYLAQTLCKDPDNFCLNTSLPQPLTPDSVEVSTVSFRGVVDTTLQQPFVEISIVVNTPSTEEANLTASQTLRTVITTRNYGKGTL